jgi:hypothetical protein
MHRGFALLRFRLFHSSFLAKPSCG